MIRDLAFVHPDFLILATDWFGIGIPVIGLFEAAIDDHAGESDFGHDVLSSRAGES